MADRTIDLVGQEFGKLTVKEKDLTRTTGKKAFWLCQCACGKKELVSVRGDCLKEKDPKKRTVSCGCHKNERAIITAKENFTKHGYATRPGKDPLYNVWSTMIRRCHKPSSSGYDRYGARGITVCEEWCKDFVNFLNWYESKKEAAIKRYGTEKLEIDRRDNDKGYNPENCRLVDRASNQRNKRLTVRIVLKGEEISFAEAVEKHNPLGLNYSLLYRRIFVQNWGIEEAFSTPLWHQSSGTDLGRNKPAE